MNGIQQGVPGPDDVQEDPETMVRRVVREELRAHTGRMLDHIVSSGVPGWELLENALEVERNYLIHLLDQD